MVKSVLLTAILFIFILAAIVITVTNAWDEAIQSLLADRKVFIHPIVDKFIYAILITVIALLILYFLIRKIEKNKVELAELHELHYLV